MKNSRLTLTIMVALTLMVCPSAMAANTNSTWTGGTGAQEWSAAGNWSGGTPGATSGVTDTSVATFNTATVGTAVNIDAGRNIKSITFDTSAGTYTIGGAGANAGNFLQLTSGGAILIAPTFTGSGITETINAPLVIGTTTAGTYAFTNNAAPSSSVLDIGGSVTGAASTSGTTVLTTTLTLNGSNAGANTISGVLGNGSNGGTLSVTKTGAGTWVLSGNNTYTGTTTAVGGTLILDYTTNSGTKLGGSSSTLALGGVNLELNGGTGTETGSITTFNGGGQANISRISGSETLALGAISQAFNQGGGTPTSVNFQSGVATTTSATSNTVNTQASLIGGAAFVTVGTTLGSYDWAAVDASGNIVGYSTVNTTAGTTNGYFVLTSANNTNTANNFVLDDTFGTSGTGTTNQTGVNTLKIATTSTSAQTLTLNTSFTFGPNGGLLDSAAGNYTITGSTVFLGGSGTSIEQWGNGSLEIDSQILGNGGIYFQKGGSGALILTGTNAWKAVLTINQGAVSVSSDANLGGASGTVTVASSSTGTATVTLTSAGASTFVVGSSLLGSTVKTISGTTVTLNANANATIASNTSVPYAIAAGITLDGGTLEATGNFSMTETGSAVQNRAISIGANGGTFQVDGSNTLTAPGVIADLGATSIGTLFKTGLGTMVVSGTNTYSGGTTISAGTLEFVNTVSTPTTGAINVNSGSTLAIAVGGAGQFGTGTSGVGTIGGIFSGLGGRGSSTVVLNSGSAVGIDTTGGSVTYAGNITNAGVGLTKLGSNALTLTGSNTYSGGTIISSGTLVVSNTSGSATGTGALQLNSGATLTGTGTIAATNATIRGTVIVGNGGTTDILHMAATGATSFTNASLTFNLDSATQNSSQLALGSTPSVVFGNTSLTLNLVGSNPIPASTGYVLFTSTATTDVYSGLTLSGSIITSGLTLTFTGPNAANYGGSYLELMSNGAGGDDIVAVVPEPGTWALMLGGLTLLMVCQRARRLRNS